MDVPHRERGAVVVEFALIVPILLLLVIGIIEFGRAYHLQTMLSGAAREAVREMALHNDPAAARTRAQDVAPNLNLTNAQIAVDAPSCTATPPPQGARATVIITYEMDFVTGLFPVDEVTLTGRGVMRCNG